MSRPSAQGGDRPEPVVIIDSSRIRPGKLDDLKSAMHDLAAFVDANEPRTIAYEVFLDEQAETVTVLQVHPDSSSAEIHMEVGAPVFGRFTELLDLRGIDVYGSPSDKLLSLLQRKGQMLGGERVTVHFLLAGFTRFPSAIFAGPVS